MRANGNDQYEYRSMSQIIHYDEGGVERQPLKTFAEAAYLNYAMYVIMDRALPNIGDGLKIGRAHV